MREPIIRIQEKLAQLKHLDKSLKIFAAFRHRYQANIPLQETYLASIERETGTNLPTGYRSFLTKIGNGGVGPYYGIYPFETSLDMWHEWIGNYRYLSQDFPLKDDCEFSDECNSPSSFGQHRYMLEHDSHYQECWNTVIEKYRDVTWFRGTLSLCEYGCGDSFFIVVQGEAPDTVWVRSPKTGIYSLKIDFLGWYEKWLDASLERVQISNFRPTNKSYSFLEYGNNPRYGSAPWPDSG